MTMDTRTRHRDERMQDATLRWHLQHNFDPPLSVGLVPWAKLALDWCVEGRGSEILRDGKATLACDGHPITAQELVNQLKL